MTYKERFEQILQDFNAAQEPDKVEEFASALHEFHDKIENAVLKPDLPRQNDLRKGAQSRQFMQQIMPEIQRYMRDFPKGSQFRILDVGPGVGSGSQLLAANYQTMELGYRARVDTTDINHHYADYMRIFCRNVRVRTDDIFDITDKYDIVIASHVIEHVPDWRAFAEQLRSLSSGIVIICAPYNENPSMLTRGHVNIIDDSFISELRPLTTTYVESAAWGQFVEPPYKMFISTLKGSASP